MVASSIEQAEIRLHPQRPQLDRRPVDKSIGLVVLATDHTTEPDFARMVASEDIAVYVTRVEYANPVTPDNLRRMGPSLGAAARLILPGAQLDALCYSCNSASVVIGDRTVEEAFQAAKPGVPVVTPPAATVQALHTIGASRISILTPYTIETSEPIGSYFEARGFDIACFTCLGFDDDREMARIPPAALRNLAIDATAPDCDALVILCTALRAALVVPEIEKEVGRPVITSNQATAWMCLRLCGNETARPELGKLFRHRLAG